MYYFKSYTHQQRRPHFIQRPFYCINTIFIKLFMKSHTYNRLCNRTFNGRISRQCLFIACFLHLAIQFLEQTKAFMSIQQDQTRTFIIIHFRVMALNAPIVGKSDVAPRFAGLSRTSIARRTQINIFQKSSHEKIFMERFPKNNLFFTTRRQNRIFTSLLTVGMPPDDKTVFFPAT